MELQEFDKKCPVCKGEPKPAENLYGGISTWFVECSRPTCNTVWNALFEPIEYQLDYLASGAKITGYFGGFGAGKTSSAGFKVFLHNMIVTDGETLIGSSNWKQMLKTNVKEMLEIIPKVLVESAKIGLHPKSGVFDVTFRNGHRIWATVFDDEGKLRSLNLTGAWVEEASEVKLSIYNQILTRMRHRAGVIYEKNEAGETVYEDFVTSSGKLRTRPKQKGTNYLVALSSNPDPGWIRKEILYKTPVDKVHYYGNDPKIESQLKIKGDNKNQFIETVVVPTYANYHLHKDYIPTMIQGKSKDWVDRYVNGSFSYAEGLVYPSHSKHIVEPFEIPNEWMRLISTDFGRRHATAHIVGAIDPVSDTLYLYDEYKKGDNAPIIEHIDGFWSIYNQAPATSWLLPPIGDPAGKTKGQTETTSWFGLYAEHGINLIASRTGKSSLYGISEGITIVSDLFNQNKLKIFSTLVETIDEISNYRYKTTNVMEGEEEANKDENPIPYNDHIMDALRGLCSMLPRYGQLSSTIPLYGKTKPIWDNFTGQNELDPSHPDFWKPKKMTNDDGQFYQGEHEAFDFSFSDPIDDISEGDIYDF